MLSKSIEMNYARVTSKKRESERNDTTEKKKWKKAY